MIIRDDSKAVGSGEAGEALASPDFRPNSNISALTFSFSSHKIICNSSYNNLFS